MHGSDHTHHTPHALSRASLADLPPGVQRPRYTPGDITPGMMHIGVGNFHRAHQATYLDALFNKNLGQEWGIVGAGFMPSDAHRRRQLQAQDWLTTIVDIGPGTPQARIIGSMIDFCQPTPKAVTERLTDPRIKAVSLTVTEGGYFIHPETGRLNPDAPAIAQDISALRSTQANPSTVFGVLLQALMRRKTDNTPPFTILSCDNVVGNGDLVRHALSVMAEQTGTLDPAWIEDTLICPNAMVDCITPATTDAERAFIADTFGIDDAAPVVCEPFRQWVIEEREPFDRPPLEEVGVEFVRDVTPYEELKLHLLNAGHAAIAYPAALLGLEYAHQAMADPDISSWLHHLLSQEVAPLLSAEPAAMRTDYITTLTQRFANPAIRDAISRLCEDGANRQPKFVLPSIRRALNHKAPITGLALETALWCRHLAADPMADTHLAPHAIATRQTPSAFIDNARMFGDLAHHPRFRAEFCNQISRLWSHGVRATLRAYLSAPKEAAP